MDQNLGLGDALTKSDNYASKNTDDVSLLFVLGFSVSFICVLSIFLVMCSGRR